MLPFNARKKTSSLRRQVMIRNALHVHFVSRVFEHVRAHLVLYDPFPSADNCTTHIKSAWSRTYNELRPPPDDRISETPLHEDIEKASVGNLVIICIRRANVYIEQK
jgi:hypothetical protein